ncbi:UNVERIFIED_CONTAM: hypothetical protein K2H54_033809, partial [Gekko kuhli]
VSGIYHCLYPYLLMMSGEEEIKVLVTTNVLVPTTTLLVTTPITTTTPVSVPLHVLVLGADGGAIPRLYGDLVRPKLWGLFKADTWESWMLTPTLWSGSQYDYRPLQEASRQEMGKEGGWEEWLTRMELSRMKTAHMLEETLLDILRLVTRVVQGKMRLQRPAPVPSHTASDPGCATKAARGDQIRHLDPRRPLLGNTS